MVILHIAELRNMTSNGVGVVVPQHVRAQQAYAQAGLVNLADVSVGEDFQLPYQKKFDLDQLPQPFHKPDLVVFHEIYRVPYLTISRQLRQRKIPYVIVPHGGLQKRALRIKWLKKAVANLLLWNRFINGAAAIQCLSETEKAETGFRTEKFIGTNGIFMSEYQPVHREHSGLRIVFIGRLSIFHKGLDILTQAAARCADLLREKSCRIEIYGPDRENDRKPLEEMIRDQGIADIMQVYDPVFGEEKEKLLQDADLFAQSSRFEGMPMGILEALSYGVPCVVTEGTAVGAYIRRYDAGWVSQTDAEDFASALAAAVTEVSSAHRCNARRLVQEEFSWDSIARETVEKYRLLAAGNGPRA